MAASFACPYPLAGTGFGARIQDPGGAVALVAAADAAPEALTRMLAEVHGLLLLPGMGAMAETPELLLRLSRIFGPEVEDYRTTGMAPNMVHPTVPEIFVVSNTPPVFRQPRRRPTRR
jgi:taurine dioxygenase